MYVQLDIFEILLCYFICMYNQSCQNLLLFLESRYTLHTTYTQSCYSWTAFCLFNKSCFFVIVCVIGVHNSLINNYIIFPDQVMDILQLIFFLQMYYIFVFFIDKYYEIVKFKYRWIFIAREACLFSSSKHEIISSKSCWQHTINT